MLTVQSARLFPGQVLEQEERPHEPADQGRQERGQRVLSDLVRGDCAEGDEEEHDPPDDVDHCY